MKFSLLVENFATSVAKFATLVGKFATLVGNFATLVGKFSLLVGNFATLVLKFATLVGKFATSVAKFATLVGNFKTSREKLFFTGKLLAKWVVKVYLQEYNLFKPIGNKREIYCLCCIFAMATDLMTFKFRFGWRLLQIGFVWLFSAK
ncbi:MAG: hypothetical protein LBB41_00120 [Prevotellaceae bacterium]|nr:hypothetical protein [Prevotellaceae bacterium]